MAKGPGLYSDIGKRARDLLNKDYQNDQKFTLSTCSATGVVSDADIGCTNCISSDCSENCVCRVQCISCSKSCRCSGTYNNRPFRKEKKIEVVKTEHCGWGVVAAESINKGDFVIEYVGEGNVLELLSLLV
ncbi:hypothetical protein POM88_011327 [Heracleum sosnowskyi]|uniref:AWS domain-containing protein n=1 Tax=Heracleum sosnowskyi TaxID=360622 RepID=A0AAD8IV95_9APIA|nr:hypothetical protein POM88_011327 [Heracleum sosnowskyi]